MNEQEAFAVVEESVSDDELSDQAMSIIAAALDERKRLRDALENIEALADRDKQRHDGAEVFVEALLPDILVLARAALKGKV